MNLISKNSLVWLILLTLVSCKSTEVITEGNVRKLTDIKLRNQLLQNQIKFDKLYSKKASITLIDGDEKKSFKGSYVIKKDSVIVVSIMALMGIEVVRGKFTPDSITIIDKHNKKAFKTNYDFFFERYNIDMDFYMLQSILSHSAFVFPPNRDLNDGLKKYKHDIKGDYYSFGSIKNKRLNRLNKRDRNNIVAHYISIIPDVYKIKDHFIKDFATYQTLLVNYNNIVKFDNVYFPQMFDIEATKAGKIFNLKIKTNYLSIDNGGSLHFKIPSSYEVSNL